MTKDERLEEADRCIEEAAKHTRGVMEAVSPDGDLLAPDGGLVVLPAICVELVAAVGQVGEAVRQLRAVVGAYQGPWREEVSDVG